MLGEKKRRAVELLFDHTEPEVAKKLRIGREELEEWFADMKFREAINTELRGYRRSSVRMLAKLYLNATMELGEIIRGKEDNGRYKIIVDILKASGVLKASRIEEEESDDPVAAILRKYSGDDEQEETGEGEAVNSE